MEPPRPMVLRRRKDRMYLPKSFCQRVGLVLLPHPRKHAFDVASYYVEVPRDYSRERAVRVARQMKMLSHKLGLGHVRYRLLDVAGIQPPPWKRSRSQRE